MRNIQIKDVFKTIKTFLKNPNIDYDSLSGNKSFINYYLSLSPQIKKIEEKQDTVNLILQFYIDNNSNRQTEISQTLFLNTYNKNIDKIYLFTERNYTPDELGVNSEKINQIVIGKRLTFKDIFDLIETHAIAGYIIFANSDIFFDKTIVNIKKCDFSKKNIMALCRYEYTGKGPLSECKLFDEGCPDSQDAWIFHSDINIETRFRDCFDFNMGKLGCDNKLIYLFQILGYTVYNEPLFIKCYHNHITQIRNYNHTEKIPPPYLTLFPVLDATDKPHISQTFNIAIENEKLTIYLQNKLTNNTPFIIPRVAGVENNVAYLGVLIKQNAIQSFEAINIDIEKLCGIMKKNAGIKLQSSDSIIKYSDLYLEAFHNSEAFFNWELWGPVSNGIYNSAIFIDQNFSNRIKIWARALDIFNYIQYLPWTTALKGKRILIISAFIKSIKEKISIRERIYGIDLFPECEFVFLKPPQTQADNYSEEFDVELNHFLKRIEEIKDTFDVALVSCGGYGNLVCSAIYKMRKSAIYVGGVLQMYFGIYGTRWISEMPDIMKLYKNNYWSRPLEEEVPLGHKKVENGCYW